MRWKTVRTYGKILATPLEVDAIISGGRFPLHKCPRVNNQVYIVAAQSLR